MKNTTISSMAILMTMNSSFAANTVKPTNEIDKVSYSVGYMMGKNVKDSAKNLNVNMLAKGMTEGFQQVQAPMSNEEMEQAVIKYQQTQTNDLSSKNIQQEKIFLAQNAKKAGVITTKSGLQYQVIKQGTGKKPKATDLVAVKYTGKLLDGKIFDSTDKHGGGPAVFPLNQVIEGWTEGLQLMPVGSKYRFYVPSKLGYGEADMAEGGIEPNSMLIFDVELIAINPPPDKNDKNSY